MAHTEGHGGHRGRREGNEFLFFGFMFFPGCSVSSVPLCVRFCLRKGADVFPDFGERVATVGRQVLRDAERREKFWVACENFRWDFAAVKIAEQSGDGFDDEGIRIAIEKTLAVAKSGNEP